MTISKVALAAMMCMFSGIISAEGTAIKLPGEPCKRPAMSPYPFPDALSAYVWRNWFTGPHDRLAAAIGASEAEFDEIGAEMGLGLQSVDSKEWRAKGYITNIRRNWHLLPYDQLCQAIGMSREELKFSLLEDDVLYIKLGMVKPKCDRIEYSKEIASKGRSKRLELARYLAEEGIADLSEEPRFKFIHSLAAVDPKLAPESGVAASPFDFRLIFSYFSDFGDPLADPEIGSCPEGLLQRLSAQGVNAVWLHVLLSSLVEVPGFPEYGIGGRERLANLKKLVGRAARYGVKIYLYLNEPRGEFPEFFAKNGREDLIGAKPKDGIVLGKWCFCSSIPENLERLSDSVAKVFSQVEGLGGIFTITCSENLTNCASRPGFKETCPRCRNRSRAEIIADTNNAMIRGMKRASPTAEALIWNWAWPKDEEPEIIKRLDTGNVRVMCISEAGIRTVFGGVTNHVEDYSIGVVGPGERAKGVWNDCRAHNLKPVAKVQVCASWELSTLPYLPTMELNARHAVNLANLGIDGVMLSWSLGGYPGPNLSVYSELRKGEREPGPMLDRLAAKMYGPRAVGGVRKAWKQFADGFVQFPNNKMLLYFGPQQMGSANPLYPEKVKFEPTMVGIPYDGQFYWRGPFPVKVFEEQFDKVAAGFAEGCETFREAIGLMEGEKRRSALRELALFRAATLHFASSADLSRFVTARNSGDKASMAEIARREMVRAKELLGYARADSRIGYESSNQYVYTPQDIREKILGCRVILEGLKNK